MQPPTKFTQYRSSILPTLNTAVDNHTSNTFVLQVVCLHAPLNFTSASLRDSGRSPLWLVYWNMTNKEVFSNLAFTKQWSGHTNTEHSSDCDHTLHSTKQQLTLWSSCSLVSPPGSSFRFCLHWEVYSANRTFLKANNCGDTLLHSLQTVFKSNGRTLLSTGFVSY